VSAQPQGALHRFAVRFGSVDLRLLALALLILAGLWIFLWLAYGVSTGSSQRSDERVLRSLREPDDPSDPLGPEWLEEVGRDLTALGGAAALLLVTAAVAGYFILCRSYRALILLLVATTGGIVLAMLLKTVYDRLRPSVVPYLAQVHTASFPSAHSMLSAVVYLTLGEMLARQVKERRLKIYFVSIGLLLSFLVGVSRLYMGVHYPTDVLAGWAAGLAWALLCGLVARWLQRRGAVERPPAT
jgi:undecaprenyl-diphosphatase